MRCSFKMVNGRKTLELLHCYPSADLHVTGSSSASKYIESENGGWTHVGKEEDDHSNLDETIPFSFSISMEFVGE